VNNTDKNQVIFAEFLDDLARIPNTSVDIKPAYFCRISDVLTLIGGQNI